LINFALIYSFIKPSEGFKKNASLIEHNQLAQADFSQQIVFFKESRHAAFMQKLDLYIKDRNRQKGAELRAFIEQIPTGEREYCSAMLDFYASVPKERLTDLALARSLRTGLSSSPGKTTFASDLQKSNEIRNLFLSNRAEIEIPETDLITARCLIQLGELQ